MPGQDSMSQKVPEPGHQTSEKPLGKAEGLEHSCDHISRSSMAICAEFTHSFFHLPTEISALKTPEKSRELAQMRIH
jgi:hypothetical protein